MLYAKVNNSLIVYYHLTLVTIQLEEYSVKFIQAQTQGSSYPDENHQIFLDKFQVGIVAMQGRDKLVIMGDLKQD